MSNKETKTKLNVGQELTKEEWDKFKNTVEASKKIVKKENNPNYKLLKDFWEKEWKFAKFKVAEDNSIKKLNGRIRSIGRFLNDEEAPWTETDKEGKIIRLIEYAGRDVSSGTIGLYRVEKETDVKALNTFKH